MPRYKLIIEYDGAGFFGWQKQDEHPSIQGALEDAVEKFCGVRCDVAGSGRTDAGVHAAGQAAHVDLPQKYDVYTVMSAINFHLGDAKISVAAAEDATEDFHARFSATRRHYLYRILNRRARPALEFGRVWHVPETLDAKQMDEAAHVLLGQHDFTSFRDSQCQAKSPLKTLDALEVRREGEEIHIRTHARSFLHHQVRIMTGSLKMVGSGKWTIADLRAALEARDRAAAGPTAPAEGLCLMQVEF